MKMAGHTDTVTCLALDPAGTHLLSNSMDGTLRSWDVRPYVEGNRLDRTFVGGTHNAEKGLLNCAWSADGTMVTGGSADRVVHIWDVPTCEGLYALGGAPGMRQRGHVPPERECDRKRLVRQGRLRRGAVALGSSWAVAGGST